MPHIDADTLGRFSLQKVFLAETAMAATSAHQPSFDEHLKQLQRLAPEPVAAPPMSPAAPPVERPRAETAPLDAAKAPSTSDDDQRPSAAEAAKANEANEGSEESNADTTNEGNKTAAANETNDKQESRAPHKASQATKASTTNEANKTNETSKASEATSDRLVTEGPIVNESPAAEPHAEEQDTDQGAEGEERAATTVFVLSEPAPTASAPKDATAEEQAPPVVSDETAVRPKPIPAELLENNDQPNSEPAPAVEAEAPAAATTRDKDRTSAPREATEVAQHETAAQRSHTEAAATEDVPTPVQDAAPRRPSAGETSRRAERSEDKGRGRAVKAEGVAVAPAAAADDARPAVVSAVQSVATPTAVAASEAAAIAAPSAAPVADASAASDETAHQEVRGRTAAARGNAPKAEGKADGPDAGGVDRVRFVQRVANAFRAAGDQGGTLRLKLSPPELGSLRMEITVQKGVMTARLEAETVEARNLLLDNLSALRERLAQQEIKVQHFQVDLADRRLGSGAEQTAQQRREDAQHPPAHGRAGQRAQRGEASAAAAGVGRIGGGSSQLDVLV